MQRRKFLTWTVSGLGIIAANVMLSGCGGGSASQISNTHQIQLFVNGKLKIETIRSGETVLDAIKKTCSYQQGNQTTIDGVTQDWRYEINGFEPVNIYADDYRITADSTIHLQSINEPF